MTDEGGKPGVTFCDDSQLSYVKFQTKFIKGQGLIFDDTYRLAHLPLVAPDHPRVIETKAGTSYNRGVHDSVYSVVIPIDAEKLLSSEVFTELCSELKATKFADKLSWDTFSLRKNKLHATICGAISTGHAPAFKTPVYRKLQTLGPVSVSIRGLFSGNINIGRLYLKVYPELRGGENMCHVIQGIFGSPLTDLYVVGLFNFVDELAPDETHELELLLDRWRDTEFFPLHLDKLWLLGSRDDLVLDGGVEKIISLG